MPSDFSISITGIQELQNYVAVLSGTLKTKLQTQVDEIVEQAYQQMQRDVPVRTGKLKKSIKKADSGGGNTMAQITVSAPYAGYVEFGTFRQRPQPFATNAYNFIISQLERNILAIK